MTRDPECVYCGATADETELRQLHEMYWDIEQDHICEECFKPSDTGPCFDDLPLAEVRQ